MVKKYFILLVISLASYACQEDDRNLPTVETRVQAAIDNLRDQLTSPANGWKLNYQPTSGSGTFLMILDFQEDGTVQISSDLAANDGEFYEQTITYRIDAGLSLELIFETYAVFHYLFELDNASYGAEFEFLFEEENGGNLYFSSKSDVSEVSTIVFEPAGSEDLNAFSREIAENFDAYSGLSPRLFGGASPTQQLYLADRNLSVFWQIDLVKRTVFFDLAGFGGTIGEVVSGDYTSLQQESGYSFRDGKMVFDQPVQIPNGGQTLTLNEIALGDFSQNGEPLCPTGTENTPVYTCTVSGAGTGSLRKNLFSSGGLGFEPGWAYTVNIPFVFDADLNSLAETGSIAEKLPGATGFIMTYGFEDDSIPANSVGFIMETADGRSELYLRSFLPSPIGNSLGMSLTESYYYTATATPEEEQALAEITDEIFAGGVVYAYELAVSGLTAFQFYNPCNAYEFVLVQ